MSSPIQGTVWPRRRELALIASLLLLASGIGAYLITTTVVISRDGVYYIQCAQKIGDDVRATGQGRPPAYPFLIYLVHTAITATAGDRSVGMWVLSAQLVALAGRVLSLIPIYLIGRHFVGPRTSMIGLAALIFLPDPARVGSDALRDWPAILFMATGFLLLLKGGNDRPWLYGWAGVVCGLGCMVRTETAQLLFYGLGWMAIGVLGADRLPRKGSLQAAGLLLLGFAIPAVFYLWCRGWRLPYEFDLLQGGTPVPVAVAASASLYPAGHMPVVSWLFLGSVPGFDLIWDMLGKFGQNLLWIYFPALVVGMVCRLRHTSAAKERFFILSALLLTSLVLAVRYYQVSPKLSSRYVLPLVAILSFYIPVGLAAIGFPLERRLLKLVGPKAINVGYLPRFDVLLLVGGILFCLPKLLDPPRMDKMAFRQSSQWLAANTSAATVVASEDTRIPFYAQRLMGNNLTGFDYAARILGDNDHREVPPGWREVYRAALDAKSGGAIVIYKTPR